MSKRLEEAKTILRTLKQNNYDAYIVGGFVRDHLLNRSSDDIDITTSATPDEVEILFDKVRHTGQNFGGVTVFVNDHPFEVTTFRKEGAYVNHRYPTNVTFSSTLTDDLVRRDFTVNALVMDENEQIHDLVEGQADLNKKLLRAIGTPSERFHEDALRILRAFRFVSKLGFQLEQTTKDAIHEHRQLVQTVAIERIMQELDKIIRGEHYQQALQAMIETKVHQELYGLAAGIEFLATCDHPIFPLEFFMIAFILGDIDDIWRFSNRDYRLIVQVIQLHEVTKQDQFNKYILFSNKLEPCLIANRINVILGYPDQEDNIKQMWNEMPVKDVCDLAFKGQDILELTTLHKRSIIGLVIDDLLREVIEGTLDNTYEALKPYALQRVAQLQLELGENNE